MRNQKRMYTASALLGIATVATIVTPASAQEGIVEVRNDESPSFIPSLSAQAFEGKNIMYIAGNKSHHTFGNQKWNGLSNLKLDLEANQFEITERSINRLKMADLLDQHIVMLNVHSLSKQMSDQQVQIFRNYVHNGGALLLLGDLHTDSGFSTVEANNLASIFGIEFLDGVLIDEQYHRNNSPLQPYVKNFTRHPITEGLDPFWVNWGNRTSSESASESVSYVRRK